MNLSQTSRRAARGTRCDQRPGARLAAGTLAILLALGGPAPMAHAAHAALAGTWHGELMQGLRLVLHFAEGAEGLGGTMDSPDQGATGIPLGEVVLAGDSLRVSVPRIGGTFVAVRMGADRLEGEWRQGGMQLPLTLERGALKPSHRPQEPQGALPYDTRDVTIETPDPEVRLAGTLTLPRANAPHPAVLLVSGSGPQDRNEEVFGHRPFLVLADRLTRDGIAVLRVDDRGVGASTGDFRDATSDDFARDAEACLNWLRAQAEVDARHVGLIGHSEGALIAPIVAGRDPQLAFAVLLAGPGVTGREISLDQAARLRLAMGADSADVARLRAHQIRIFDEIARSGDTAGTGERLRGLMREGIGLLPESERARIGDPERVIDVQMAQMSSPWFRFFLAHDPAPALAAMRCPVLALFGAKDFQVAPEINRAPMERALAGNRDAEVNVLPGLNHMFQNATSGLPMEYAQIDETFDPATLAEIGDWILTRTGRTAQRDRR